MHATEYTYKYTIHTEIEIPGNPKECEIKTLDIWAFLMPSQLRRKTISDIEKSKKTTLNTYRINPRDLASQATENS